MPVVDLEKVAKEYKVKEDSRNMIRSRQVGDQTYYKGPYLDGWYETADEALRVNQEHSRIQEFKKLGLDENGRTPAQVRLHEAKMKMLAERQKILDEIRKIDIKISQLRESDFEDKKKK